MERQQGKRLYLLLSFYAFREALETPWEAVGLQVGDSAFLQLRKYTDSVQISRQYRFPPIITLLSIAAHIHIIQKSRQRVKTEF